MFYKMTCLRKNVKIRNSDFPFFSGFSRPIGGRETRPQDPLKRDPEPGENDPKSLRDFGGILSVSGRECRLSFQVQADQGAFDPAKNPRFLAGFVLFKGAFLRGFNLAFCPF